MTMLTGFDQAVVVDVETTGLDPKADRIVSVALIRANFGNLKENPNSLDGTTMDAVINPQCRIPKESSRIHGITNKDVADKSSFSDMAQEVRDFIGDLPIISHNASFDKSFLSSEFKRASVKTLSRNRSYCTMQRFQEFNHDRQRGSNLDDVVEVMGVKGRKGKVHDAIEDAKLAWQVACLFYMMDNRIEIPGGKPVRPSRSSKSGEDGRSKRQSDGYKSRGLIYGSAGGCYQVRGKGTPEMNDNFHQFERARARQRLLATVFLILGGLALAVCLGVWRAISKAAKDND